MDNTAVYSIALKKVHIQSLSSYSGIRGMYHYTFYHHPLVPILMKNLYSDSSAVAKPALAI